MLAAPICPISPIAARSRRPWLRPARSLVVAQQTTPQFLRCATTNAPPAPMHEVRLHGIAIVPAHEVQRTVSGEQIELHGERHADPSRLPRGSIRGDHDLPDEGTR